jgi:hypothetical protein
VVDGVSSHYQSGGDVFSPACEHSASGGRRAAGCDCRHVGGCP